MVFQRFSLNTAFTKTFLCIFRLVLCTASLGVISLSCSTTSSRITSTIPSVHATHTERSFAPGEYQRSVGYTHVQVQALSMVVDRGTSHMPPKVPASIIPFVLDSVTEARPADQVICRRNLAGTWGNIAETDSLATEFTWTTGKRQFELSTTPTGFCLWAITQLSDQANESAPSAWSGLGGTTRTLCGRVCCSGQLCAIGALKHSHVQKKNDGWHGSSFSGRGGEGDLLGNGRKNRRTVMLNFESANI